MPLNTKTATFATPVRRFLSAILAILVLVLSCIPCDDAAAAAHDADAHAESTMKAAPDGECPIHHADHCSPFCTCSCCAGIALPVSVFIKARQPFLFVEKPIAAHFAQAVGSIALPIWQPPQLG